MKHLIIAALTAATLTTSTSAGGITVTLPNLTFPPSQDITIAKPCLPDAAATGHCSPRNNPRSACSR